MEPYQPLRQSSVSNKDHSIPYLSPWLLESLVKLKHQRTYPNGLVSKRFLNYDGPQVNDGVTPLVRLYAFTKVTEGGGVVALVNDSTHLMIVLFTQEAVIGFENRYGQRLTYETANRLVILRRANLCLVDKFKDFHLYAQAFQGLNWRVIRDNEMCYLEAQDVEIFLHDEVKASAAFERQLRPVYCEREYAEVFRRDFDAGLDEDSDGIVSDPEQIPTSRIGL